MSSASLDRVRVVLTQTSHPGNIGAAARAMKTMGLSKLVLVRPKYFPDAQANAMATGAVDILAGARVVDSLAQALAGREVVGRDDQQTVDAFERRVERGGIVEIGAARLDPLGGEIGKLGGIARGGDHLAGSRGEQVFDDQPAEMAAGAGDEEGR